ncbi:hypothetical protein IW18_00890 [Flavobacterium hibernum]|uniref:Uncharacterized protein n=1 Tax=Flavobacterium hibernum TaxID=37752 RepID=A0A0D0EFS1_9FLAO|nr:hypothetical protein IW18_00890 [Flavobacterium hibernum]OXA84663.1 hypothetical protein B0A73_18790 [Flavobacterium hibernum]
MISYILQDFRKLKKSYILNVRVDELDFFSVMRIGIVMLLKKNREKFFFEFIHMKKVFSIRAVLYMDFN